MSQIQLTPKIIIDGSTSNEPFVKFTQNHQWTSSNFCLHVNNGFTNLNGIIINGALNANDTFYTNNNNINMSFNVTGNNNIIFKTNNIERLRIFNNGNIGIGTINAQDYKVNINGSINTQSIYKNNIELDNIYLAINNNCWLFDDISKILYTDPNSNISRIGIGNTNPDAYLHIGSYNIPNSDATIILSKNTLNNNSHNFKLGYDNDFNFVMGNFVPQYNSTWKSQFSINYDAPDNSLFISSTGNIGINTNITNDYKVNILGSLNASSITTDIGSNINNLNYNNITINKPDLKNLDNWTINNNIIYLTNLSACVAIGTTTTTFNIHNSDNSITYKLNVSGALNSTNYYVNGTNISDTYLKKIDAQTTYLSISDFNTNNIWMKDGQFDSYIRLNNANIGKIVTLGDNNPDNYGNLYLNVYGRILAKYFDGDGGLIKNINYSNIDETTIPNYLTISDALANYYNKTYMNVNYSNTIFTEIKRDYPTRDEFDTLTATLHNIINELPADTIAVLIDDLAKSNELSIFYSNIVNIPFKWNSSNFGFNADAGTGINDIMTIGGTLNAVTIKSSGYIFENNTLLKDIYMSSNNYLNNISNYQTISNSIKSQFTPLQLYPPISSSKFLSSYSNIISTSEYGNGFYIIQTSTNLLSTINPSSTSYPDSAPGSNLFNYDNEAVPWITNTNFNRNYTANNFTYPTSESPAHLSTKISISLTLYGHSILLYYFEKFIISKIEIIIKDDSTVSATIINAPKTIYLLATNNNVLFSSQSEYNENNSPSLSWVILLNNITLTVQDYKVFDSSLKLYSATIEIPNNITEYKFYKLIITSTIASEYLSIQQLKYYGYENKKSFMHSGNNIYSLSNITIGTIDNLSPYKLNVNGNIYSSSNIYANSNIGIGITSPLGNLHIGNPNSNSDGTLIISKNDNINNRNFKFGYDSKFNFIFGDFGTSDAASRTWKKQFYINSNAPEDSFMISSNGNVGINTINNSLNHKLFINGNFNVTGCINQSDANNSNTFKSDIYASNNIYIFSNLNVSNIFTSNINVSNNISVNGIIHASRNIGIGTSTNLNASLNIQSPINTIGIWNACFSLTTQGDKITSFIGKNSTFKNGFYNYYNHQGDGLNNNYISWATSNVSTIADLTPDILCMNALKYVGIGVTNPTALFQISNGGKFKIGPDDNDYALIGLNKNDGNTNTKINLNGGGIKRIEYSAAEGGHIFYTNNSNEQMRINNSGNISIGNTSDIYKLNVNGNIYSSSNIYANSNIGIGITSPLGNLHIGNPTIINTDGTLIISKNDNTNNRNFKFGYDSKFNFIFGDFGTSDAASRTWKKQFYINSNAPEDSFIISSNGNIGIANISPLGNLHIGNPTIINTDGTLIISKNDNINNRNFKFGYDSKFNFIFGDFGTSDDVSRTWKKQFYINSNAPEDSFIISSNGNIGIGTSSISNQKLYVKGDTTIKDGVLTQISSTGFPNMFNNAIIINKLESSGRDYRLDVNGNVNVESNLNTSNLNVNYTTVLNGLVRIGLFSSTLPAITDENKVLIQNNTLIKGSFICEDGSFTHRGTGTFNINTTGNLSVNTTQSSFIGKIGIGTNTSITNILQVGDGGRLRIANDENDYTVIGSKDIINSDENTKIIINGYNNGLINKGNIQYYTTNNGNHLFYANGTTTKEIVRFDSSGNVGIGTTTSENIKLNVNGNINCISLISSNNINIGIDPLDKTKILNVYGSIFATSNISITCNIITSNINSSNINNNGNISNIGNLILTGNINQTGSYDFRGTAFNIGNIIDTNKTLTVGGNIISSLNITAYSNIETTTLRSLFSSNTSNLYTCNIIVSGSTILNSNIIQNNSFPISLTGELTLNSSTINDQLIINNTSSTNYSRIKFTNNESANNFGYIGIGGTNISGNYQNNIFIQSKNSIILNSGNKMSSYIPSLLITSSGNIGISTATANNIFQIGDGGRLRIANDINDYTVIGSMNDITNSSNTKIVINGFNNATNRGDIQYYATSNGRHLFYSGGGTKELMRIDSNGNIGIGTVNSENFKLNINGDLNVKNLITENSSYLSNVYVKFENLSNLNLNNFNLKKKFGYNCIINDKLIQDIIYNSTVYYKFDIDLRTMTRNLVNTIGQNSVCYRSFNIKCFSSDCSFETFNNNIPNILQYDIYMSSNPIMQTTYPQITASKPGLNICAIGTPENYNLDKILPSYMTLLRYDTPDHNFNFLSLVSPNSNLNVSFIIEDYLS